MSLPTGTVTFLFTDIEGSTRLWEQQPKAMRDALARHDVLMHQSIADHSGIVFKTMGDAFCAAFATAPQALMATLIAQQSLQSETWPDPVSISVRMALHTGAADERDGDYFGPPLNRVARLMSAGYGGQILLSQATFELVRDALPVPCILQDLGAHSLRDLARPEQVYQLCHPDLPSEFPPLKSLDSLPNNLPQQMTSFIGREKELTQVKDLLSKTRLLTLTGSGGAGKTRLSLQTAADVLDSYADGIWLVELAPLTDPALVPQTVASVLGVKEQPGKTFIQLLTDYLKAKTLLLVLDNCEHVLDATAKLAATLLRSCPQVKILASSREGLGIAGELTYRVPSLSLPDAKTSPTVISISSCEAVQLFVERALFHKPDFAVTNANAPALASMCHRLDGIPLAIELASARIRSLSVEEINSKLDNRFRLLTGGSRTALPRQQTLRALIDWSYGLLTEQEKTLLVRLSVFAGGWTLEAVEAICTGDSVKDWEVLDLLTSLVDKSLVSIEEMNGQTRYRFLETVRQYGRDKLDESGEASAIRDKHAAYFLSVAELAASGLQGPEQIQWLTRLETEHDNLRAALAWFQDMPDQGGVLLNLRLGSALVQFWLVRGYLGEGRRHLSEALNAPGTQSQTKERSAALHGEGVLASYQSEFSQARLLTEESLAIAREMGNKRGIAAALATLGFIALNRGHQPLPGQPQADTLVEESLLLSRELGDQHAIVARLNELGNIAILERDLPRARVLLEESRDLSQKLGDQRELVRSLTYLGAAFLIEGDYDQACLLCERGLLLARELGDKLWTRTLLRYLGLAARNQKEYAQAQVMFEENLSIGRQLENQRAVLSVLCTLGGIACDVGDYPKAEAYFVESLTAGHQLTYSWIFLDNLEGFAKLSALRGEPLRAARLWGAAEALREAVGAPLLEYDRETYDRSVMTARERIGEDAFAAAWAEGRGMSMEQAVAYALEG